MPAVTPAPPRIEQPEIDELVDEIRALIEEARRRARRRRFFVAVAVAAALVAGAAALFHGGGEGATLGRSEADAAPTGIATPERAGTWGASHGPEGAFVTAIASAPNALYVGTIQSGIFKSTDRGRTWRAVGDGLTPALRVDALAVDPARPLTVYAGSGDGVFKTTNGGVSWHRASRGMFKSPFRDARSHRLIEGYIGNLAIDPRRPRVLYASTWAGVLKSTDAARTWSPFAPLRRVSQVVFAPSDPSVVLARAWDGGIAGSTRLRKSNDGGRTWAPLRIRLPLYGVRAVAFDPKDADTFYVAVGYLGLLATHDGGDTWRRLEGPGGGVLSFALDPAASRTLYMSTRSGIFKSTDGGTNWHGLNGGLVDGERPWLVDVDRHATGTVYASGGGRLLRSLDSGATWTGSTNGLSATHVTSLALASKRLYAGTGGSGVSSSSDGGRSWRRLKTPAVVWSVVSDPKFEHTIYAATDSSAVLRSDDDGRSWRAASGGLPVHRVFGLAADERTGKLFAGTGSGIFESSDRGGSWQQATTSWTASFAVLGDAAYAGGNSGGFWRRDSSGTWHLQGRVCCSSLTIALDPHDPEVVYAGDAQGVFRSSDGGATWKRAGLRGVQVQALAVDPADSRTLYAGSWRRSGVYRTTDGGRTWKPFNAGLPPGGVGALRFSADGRRLYAGTLGYGVVALTISR